MRLHFEDCPICERITMFVEKLVDPKDPYCKKIHDVCMECWTPYHVEPKIKPKV